MTIYHKHHIVPKHMGGTDDPSNLISLTLEEHAEAHKKLWEKHGKWQDKCAWLCLSNQIGKEEIMKMIQIEAGKSNKGVKRTEEWRKKQSDSQKGNKHALGNKGNVNAAKHMIGNNFGMNNKGKKWKQNKPRTPEHMAKLWESRRKNKLSSNLD